MVSSRDAAMNLDFEEHDKENPRTFSTQKKILIAFHALFSAFAATIPAPIYIASVPGVVENFDVSTTLSVAPISLYAAGLGIGTLVSTASAEVLGRTIVYRTTLPLAFAFTVLGGSATEFRTLAVARILAGIFASPSITIGVGMLNDIWDTSLEKTGTLFAVGLVLFIIWATQMGPMMGASIVQVRDWRWTFWLTAIFFGISLLSSLLIPETYKPEILKRRAKKLKSPVPSQDGFTIFIVSIGRPIHMLATEPILLPAAIVTAMFQACLFFFYVAYALVFQEIYSFTPYQVGMCFGPFLIGSVLAVPAIGIFDKLTYQKARERAIQTGKTVAPEKRLYPAMMGSILLPIAIFWFAWTSRVDLHWMVPISSGVLFGFAYVLVMLCLPVYTNDIYGTQYGASAIAGNSFVRFLLSAPFPLFTVQMIAKLGVDWSVSLVGFITVAMIPVPLVFYQWGPTLRAKSSYVATPIP